MIMTENIVDNTTAIILAAGMGKRMGAITASIPKALIEINGTPLIDYSIAFVSALGFKQIIIVGGFEFSKLKIYLDSKYKDLIIVEYKDFEKQNLLSLMKCLELAEDVVGIVGAFGLQRGFFQEPEVGGKFRAAVLKLELPAKKFSQGRIQDFLGAV